MGTGTLGDYAPSRGEATWEGIFGPRARGAVMAGRCYLVTGASGGIGSAVVRRIATAGDTAIVMARRREPLQELEKELVPSIHAFAGDAQSPPDLEQAVTSGIARYGRLDGLAHCVGSLHLKPIHLSTPEEFQAVINTNLTSAFLATRAVFPELRKANAGSVVLLSTVACVQGLVNHEVIAAAKEGIEAMIRSAAVTYARSNIRFNAVAPGMTRTSLTAGLLGSEASRQYSESLHPLGRIGEPDEVAEAIIFLLSAASGWITGQVLGVDGGLSSGIAPPRAAPRR